MQTNKTIPEFLCYRYKGVRRVDQILATCVPFAWKCRRYQNWKEVQNATDDKELLRRVADALLDGGNLNLADYGRISGIFYNVQRWRKDKQELAEEPDTLAGWTELACLLHVVAGNPKVAVQKLEKEITNFKNSPPVSMLEFFYGWTLSEMLKTQKVPDLPQFELNAGADANQLESQISGLVRFLYASVGLVSPPTPDVSPCRFLISALHADLGFCRPVFDYAFSKEDLTHLNSPKTITVCYAKLTTLQLFKITEVEGHLHIAINMDHAFVRDAAKSDNTKALLETFLSAYAEAQQQLPAQQETIDALTSYLGLILKRRTSDNR